MVTPDAIHVLARRGRCAPSWDRQEPASRREEGNLDVRTSLTRPETPLEAPLPYSAPLQGRNAMVLEKETLTLDDLEAQYAAELPEREMLGLITIIITNVLNNLSIDVDVKNNNVAVQVCAVVNVLNTILDGDRLTCVNQQR